MSESKNLLHSINKGHHEHEDGQPCEGERLDKSNGHLIRGLVDGEGIHWLSRDDVLTFVSKEVETWQNAFTFAMQQGDMAPQYLLAGQVMNKFGFVLDESTKPEVAASTDFDEAAFFASLSETPKEEPPTPAPGLDSALGDIVENLRRQQEGDSTSE